MGGHSLLISILIMINYIKKEKNIPEIWDNVIIQTIYKNKRSKKKLENYRGIFITSILSKILEKLIQLRIKNKITEYSSPFQVGGTPNRSTADNLFLLRGIIDHTIYLNTGKHFTFYDFKQCFDSIWLKESMNCMWDAGARNELFYLIYLLNKNANITVRTPFGETEEFRVKNLVKQGTCLGPILCGISTGQYCTERYSTNSGIYIGSVKINPLAFVDDIADPNRSKLDNIRGNENAMFFEKVKRLTFSVDKCKSLNINTRKEEIPTLNINGSTVENAKEFKYLGD